ncbi:MAG: SGNH/GDSL hydrolase family protein [Ignavibacteriae bacterium]|nr:SGNH/GDSL hydrolase family protein [Ignavibacteriota bacterium]
MGGVQHKRLQFLALGDSYTIGESVDPSDRWPVQLVKVLRKQGVEIEDPIVIARTGWTTDELMTAIEAQRPNGRFDLVSLLIGVNNQYRGRSLEEYTNEFRSLLLRAIGFAGGRPDRVLVLSIPDWGVTPFAEGRDRNKIAGEIDEFNAKNRDEAERSGVHYVNVTTQSREAVSDVSLLAEDGLHPSARSYAAWVQLIEPIALRIFRGGKDD